MDFAAVETMLRIDAYYLFYKPHGNGVVMFRIQGENQFRTIDGLSSGELAAAVTVLSQEAVYWDIQNNRFAASKVFSL